jgi:hypothetical protein
MDTVDEQTIRATQGTCPNCAWNALHRTSLGVIAAAAAHTRAAHPDIAAARYYFCEDAWQRIPIDFNFVVVDAHVIPAAGQLALFGNC